MTPHVGLLTAELICAGRTLRRVGRRVVCVDETTSTMDDAFALAIRDGPIADGAVIFAERQTAGRGRLGRKWLSPRGASIHCSLLLFEPPDHAAAGRIALAAGLAVCRAIVAATELTCSVRWPNDVYIRGKKVAGVLIERRDAPRGDAATIVGIGINCLQQAGHFDASIRERATSLEIESAAPIDRVAVARSLLVSLDAYFAIPGRIDAASLLDEWRARSDDLGTYVTVLNDGRRISGRILDIDPDASLLFQPDAGGRIILDAATTTVLERHS